VELVSRFLEVELVSALMDTFRNNACFLSHHTSCCLCGTFRLDTCYKKNLGRNTHLLGMIGAEGNELLENYCMLGSLPRLYNIETHLFQHNVCQRCAYQAL
jgi:hypothetical protein